MERRQFVAGTATAITVGLAGCGILSDGPADVAKQYLQALGDGDSETLEELSHDDARVPTTTEETELTINSVEKVSIDDVADEEGMSDEERQEFEESLEDEVDNIGADDYAFVSYDVETEEYGQEEGYMVLVKEGGSWLVYSV